MTIYFPSNWSLRECYDWIERRYPNKTIFVDLDHLHEQQYALYVLL